MVDEFFFSTVFHAGVLSDDFADFWIGFAHIIDGFEGKWTGGGVFDVEFDIGFIIGDAKDVLFGEDGGVFFGHIFGVVSTDFE